MATTAIDYKRTHFEKPDLTQIRGQPSFETLSQLIRELKANAQCVHTNLGGGNLGHLGLVLTDAQYALISTALFVRPTHPGPLLIVAGTTGPMSTVLKEQHKETLRSFHEVHNVEKSLKQQIVAALEPQFFKAIRNRTTQTITRTIPETIEFLMEQYGNITPNDYIERESQVKSMIYDIDTPIDTVFDEVEDFVEFATHAKVTTTQAMTVTIGYVILWKTGKLNDGIKEWDRKPAVQQTWINFKDHFRAAHKAELSLNHKSVSDTVFQQHANMIREAVQDGIMEIMANNPPPDEEKADDIIQHQANNAASNPTLAALTLQMQQMQTLLTTLASQHQGGGGRGGRGGRSGRGGRGSGRNNGYRERRNISSYCWSHGACAHTSSECTNQRPGHQTTATFKNKMGGSTWYCPTAS